MKRLKYGLLAAALVASAAVVPAAGVNAEAVDGAWVKDAKGWHYVYEDGTSAAKEFVGGYWMNAAGTMTTGHTYVWSRIGANAWTFGDKTWQAGETAGKAEWWKIDGNWYYFHKNGLLAINEYTGKYYVDEKGVWQEDVTAKWEKDGKDWRFAVTKGEETSYLTDCWATINGKDYHFNADGKMDSWKVLKEVDEDGNSYFYGIGGTGALGRLTWLDIDEDYIIPYELTFNFKKSEKVQAAQDMRDLLLNTLSYKKDEPYVFDILVNAGVKDRKQSARTVYVGYAYQGEEPVESEEGNNLEITYKEKYVKNVWVSVDEDEIKALVADEDYKGTWGVFRGVEENDVDICVPIVNYMNHFAKSNDVTIAGLTDLDTIFTKWSLAGIQRYDHEIVLNPGADEEVKITRFGMSEGYFGIDVDGKHYQACYDVDAKKGTGRFIFLGDVSQTLGKKLYDLFNNFDVKNPDDWYMTDSLVDGYCVYQTATTPLVYDADGAIIASDRLTINPETKKPAAEAFYAHEQSIAVKAGIEQRKTVDD